MTSGFDRGLRLILDCDPGNGIPGADVDDALAIGLALRHPRVEIAGITVVAGNVPLESGLVATRELLAAASRSEVPVYAGASRPILQNPDRYRAWLDGRGAPESSAVLSNRRHRPAATPGERAAEAIVREARSRPGELVVVALGPLTNIAIATLVEPELPRLVRQVVVMGGSLGVPGVVSELNFAYDPEAAHIVLASGAEIKLVPLDVTTQTLLTLDDLAVWSRSRDPLREYLASTTEPWIKWVQDVRGIDGCWLHDPLAVAVAIDESLVQTSMIAVDVELASPYLRGRVVSAFPPAEGPSVPIEVGPTRIPVATSVDSTRFKEFFMESLVARPIQASTTQ